MVSPWPGSLNYIMLIKPDPVTTISLWFWVIFSFYHIHFYLPFLEHILCARLLCEELEVQRYTGLAVKEPSLWLGRQPANQKITAQSAVSMTNLGSDCRG